MSPTMIIALVAAFIGLGMAGTIRVQHSNNVAQKAKADAAVAANKSLTSDIDTVRRDCKTASDTLQKEADKFKTRALAAEKIVAKNRAARNAEQHTLDLLEAMRVDATPKSTEDSCAQINGIIDQWVIDSLR